MTNRIFTPGQFARHLERIAATTPEMMHHTADRCGEIVEKSAKAEVGFYQPERGPFVEWEQLADSTEDDKARHGYSVEAPLLRTGQMRDSISHTTEGGKTVVGSDDPKIIYHEFGTSKMPPRPVLGPALFMNEHRITVGLGRVMAAWLGGFSWKREAISDKGTT